MMSKISYRHAWKTSKGTNKLDLNACNTAVSMLKMNPSMPARMMRPLLRDVSPSETNINGKYVDNFRRCVMLYHAKNSDSAMVTMEEGIALTKRSNISESDFIGMNDPIIQTNFREVYGKIMREDSNTWSAIQFLKTCKDTIHGFDYRVLYSKTGLPNDGRIVIK